MVNARRRQTRRRALISIPPMPKTITLLAVGFLIGNLLFLPMIAILGKYVDPDYREAVMTIAGLFKDGMLLILGYYFRDKAGKQGDEE